MGVCFSNVGVVKGVTMMANCLEHKVPRLSILLAVLAFLLALALPLSVAAQIPGTLLIGTATVDGAAAQDGALVEAFVEATKIGQANTPISGGAAGSFRLQSDANSSFAGKTINFRVTPPGKTGLDASATSAVTYQFAVAVQNIALVATTPVTPSAVLTPLITVNALNVAFSPDPANPGKFLSFVPNTPGNNLNTVQPYQTVIVNVTVAGQAIPAGFRGQPGQTALNLGVNYLTYAP